MCLSIQWPSSLHWIHPTQHGAGRGVTPWEQSTMLPAYHRWCFCSPLVPSYCISFVFPRSPPSWPKAHKNWKTVQGRHGIGELHCGEINVLSLQKREAESGRERELVIFRHLINFPDPRGQRLWDSEEGHEWPGEVCIIKEGWCYIFLFKVVHPLKSISKYLPINFLSVNYD